ncbi:MAG TPA: amidohydrolase family protein [Gemmatimonadaceae bacterium]|nr:amidohydrolase family protein [Gemmatimonadaceae bacterium]
MLRWMRAVLLSAFALSQVRAQAGQPRQIALTRVTIIDPARDSLLRDATVLLSGERVVAVGPRRSVAIPRGAQVIDGNGKFLIPGLWDMHVHMAQPLSPGLELATNAGYFFPLFIAYGVTGVRDMAGDLATLRAWRDEIAKGTRVGPHLFFTGEKLGKGPVVAGAPFPLRTRRDIELSVKALWDSGASFVKLHDIAPDRFSTLTRDAWLYNLPVVGHVETHHSLRELARAGMRSVEHLDGVLLASSRGEDSLRRALLQQERASLWHRALIKARVRKPIPYPAATMAQAYDGARADSLFDLLRQTATWQCPTLHLLGRLYRQTDPALRLPPDSLLVRDVPNRAHGFADPPFPATHPLSTVYARLAEVVRTMSRRGVGLLAGTDTPGLYAVPGLSLHQELALLVSAGLTPREALRAATTGPADFFEVRDSLGTIREGVFADLILLDADPLVDIANTRRIHAVFARGRFLDRAALDRMIAGAAQVARRIRAAAP